MPFGRFCGMGGLCDDLALGGKNGTRQKARYSAHLEFPVANLAQPPYTLMVKAQVFASASDAVPDPIAPLRIPTGPV